MRAKGDRGEATRVWNADGDKDPTWNYELVRFAGALPSRASTSLPIHRVTGNPRFTYKHSWGH